MNRNPLKPPNPVQHEIICNLQAENAKLKEGLTELADFLEQLRGSLLQATLYYVGKKPRLLSERLLSERLLAEKVKRLRTLCGEGKQVDK